MISEEERYQRHVESELDELKALAPRLKSLFDSAYDLPTSAVLLALPLGVVRLRFGLHSIDAMSIVASFSRKLAFDHGYTGGRGLQEDEFPEEDVRRGFERARDLFPELEKMLFELSTPGATMHLVASLTVIVARGFGIAVESLLEEVQKNAITLEKLATDLGAFDGEEAAAAIRPHILVQNYRACIKLMDAAAEGGREGFVAYLESSPYLREPSGFSWGKYVALADLPGAYGPISARVTASFTSLGNCKRVYALFIGNGEDLLALRGATCETFAQIYGPPTHANERRAEWAFLYDNCEGEYTVELEEEFREWHLNVSLRMKKFW